MQVHGHAAFHPNLCAEDVGVSSDLASGRRAYHDSAGSDMQEESACPETRDWSVCTAIVRLRLSVCVCVTDLRLAAEVGKDI